MRRETTSVGRLSVVRVTIQGPDWDDAGIGIVIAQHPLTLLVPSHLIELVSQGKAEEVQVNGVVYKNARILPTPALQRDHLSVLQFPKKYHRDLSSAQLPRHRFLLTPGQSVSLQRVASDSNASGTVVDVREQGDGQSIITDIAVSTGDSGSPLLVSGKLAAICQGMIERDGSGNAVAVPLSDDSLTELRKASRSHRLSLFASLISIFLAAILALVGFAIFSSISFSLAGIQVSEDGMSVTATNAQAVTFRHSWTRPFDSPIRRSLSLPSSTNGHIDRVAIGTVTDGGINGAITLLSSNGRPLWSYSVPDGECIYSTPTESYNGFLVDRIYSSDLDQDGHTELLVVFVHDHFFPCKLVAFSMEGDILGEFWHPGYIRAIATGTVGASADELVVVSASNNRLKLESESINPQTLFAFRGLDISGQAPPYTGTSGSPSALAPSHELWMWVIANVDPSLFRAKCADFNITDTDSDGFNDIQAPLSDGRFYNLDESGRVLSVELGDRFIEMFPNTPPPPLVEFWEYFADVEARAAAEASGL